MIRIKNPRLRLHDHNGLDFAALNTLTISKADVSFEVAPEEHDADCLMVVSIFSLKEDGTKELIVHKERKLHVSYLHHREHHHEHAPGEAIHKTVRFEAPELRLPSNVLKYVAEILVLDSFPPINNYVTNTATVISAPPSVGTAHPHGAAGSFPPTSLNN